MPRPIHVTYAAYAGPTSLAVTWCDGRSSCVELAGWIAGGGPALAVLKEPRRFAAARIEADGARLAWDAATIGAEHLWRIAAEQRAFSRAELIAWQAEIGLSNQEAAAFLGISLSAWNTYKSGRNPVPATVAMVCRAALRDPILRQARHKPIPRGRPRRADTASCPTAEVS